MVFLNYIYLYGNHIFLRFMEHWLSPCWAQCPCAGIAVRAAATGRMKGTKVGAKRSIEGTYEKINIYTQRSF